MARYWIALCGASGGNVMDHLSHRNMLIVSLFCRCWYSLYRPSSRHRWPQKIADGECSIGQYASARHLIRLRPLQQLFDQNYARTGVLGIRQTP
jgi:hypothetical protein